MFYFLLINKEIYIFIIDLMQSTSTLSVTLHRFYLNESKAVRFSTIDDSLLILLLILSSYITTHGLYFLINLLHHNNKKNKQFIWDVFIQDNATLVGLLLGAWFCGYCFVSWTVYYQFEGREVRHADDYVMVNSTFDYDDDDHDNSEEYEKKDFGNKLNLEVVPNAITTLPNGTVGLLYDPIKENPTTKK